MAITYSHNESTFGQAKDFLIPSKEEVILYLTIAVVILAALNYRVFIELFTRGSGLEAVDSQALMDENLTLIIYQANLGLGTATVSAFWMIVGSISYAFVWLARSLALQAREDNASLDDVAPEAHRKGHKHRIISRYTAFFAALVGLAGFLGLFIGWILPSLSKKAVLWATVSTEYGSFLWLIGAVLGVALSLYILKLLLRTFGYMMATFGNN